MSSSGQLTFIMVRRKFNAKRRSSSITLWAVGMDMQHCAMLAEDTSVISHVML